MIQIVVMTVMNDIKTFWMHSRRSSSRRKYCHHHTTMISTPSEIEASGKRYSFMQRYIMCVICVKCK